MERQIKYLLDLTEIDVALDEYAEDFGDLPDQLNKYKAEVEKLGKTITETEKILADVLSFEKNANKTLLEMAEREKDLTDKQFKVRNNKEFDAITKEIEHIRSERNRISQEMSSVGVKEMNLNRTLEEQRKTFVELEKELKVKEEEFEIITSDQNEDVRDLRRRRKEIIVNIEKIPLEDYTRIRTHHSDAVVQIKKRSCSGCFSTVPAQKIVEIRNNAEKLFTCENCGRLLYPQEVEE